MSDYTKLKEFFLEKHHYSYEKFADDYTKHHGILISQFNCDEDKRITKFTIGARLASFIKKYKTSSMISFILKIGEENKLDLTPQLVKKLCSKFFNRKGAQKIIVDVFGKKNRKKKGADTSDFKVDCIYLKHKEEAQNNWKLCLDGIKKIQYFCSLRYDSARKILLESIDD